MKERTHNLGPLVNWLFAVAALVIQLFNTYSPIFLYQTSFETMYLPGLHLSVDDAVAGYLVFLLLLGGPIAFGIMLSNMSYKVRERAAFYFGGWILGWCFHVLRWWLR